MALNTDSIINDARAELKARVEQRVATDRRIAELRILLRSLVRFVTDDTKREAILQEIDDARRKAPSLVQAIAELLKTSKTTMSSNQIRDALEQSGFDLDEYSQPLATIQATLQRLVDAKKVRRDLGANKTVNYSWRTEVQRGEIAKGVVSDAAKRALFGDTE